MTSVYNVSCSLRFQTVPAGVHHASYIPIYIVINPRSRVTIQESKSVSDEIEKGSKTQFSFLCAMRTHGAFYRFTFPQNVSLCVSTF